MSQTKDDLEQWWSKPDAWDYQTTKDDVRRRELVSKIIGLFGNNFDRYLDIGSGEGFMTIFIRAIVKHGIELSDNAAERFPSGLKRVDEPIGKYDLITALGVLYEQYDYEQMQDWIETSAGGLVVTSHYDKAGVAHDEFDRPQIFYAEFPYRTGKQILRVYQWAK